MTATNADSPRPIFLGAAGTCRPLRNTPAMAAKVTERLWEIGDIVDVLESLETARQRTT